MLADQRERELILTALNETIVVEAAAGTGKTTELVNRIISVLADGHAEIKQIVAVTFTEKAAGELRLRLRSELENKRHKEEEGSPRYNNLVSALAQLEEGEIDTIHGFCADILRERPVEALLDPQFEAMNEAQARRVQRQAFRLWLQKALNAPPEGVRRYLRRDVKRGPAESLWAAAAKLAVWRDYPTPWRRPEFDRAAAIDSLVEQLRNFAHLTATCGDTSDRLYSSTLAARRFADQLAASEAVSPRDYDALEAQFVSLYRNRDFREPQKGRAKKYSEGVSRAEVLQKHEELITALRDFVSRANADLAALLRSELQEPLAAYEDCKFRLGRLDFLDLLIRTRNLLRDNASVRADLQKRFARIFVDEFQDTDPVQAEILLLLACGDPSISDWRKAVPKPGKLFIVGDPKQAVYRFRRADVGVYQDVKDLLKAHGAVCLNLTTSFRAQPALQNLVNAAFAPIMKEDAGIQQASYVPLSPFRSSRPEQPAIVALSVPNPYKNQYVTGGAIDASLPDAVGAFVYWLLKESGWKVNEGKAMAPIRADHICILLRRFESYGEDKAGAYAQALEARDIPHRLIGGRSFHQREEVETLRTALTAIEWPDDELAVFATLRGSLFSIGDEPLFEYRVRYGRFHPFRIPKEELIENLRPIKGALTTLQELHKQRNYRPVSETLNRLLESTRAHVGFALRPSGEQVLANVLYISELARSYESGGGISFRGFIEQLEEDAERGQAPEAPILEEGSEGVRIMTVHKAKGLEFPVVVLGGITAPLAHEDADCFIDSKSELCALQLEGLMPLELQEHQAEEAARNRAEGIRIAYVAATRARDVLVVPAVADDWADKRFTDPSDWWIAPLFPAIFPSESARSKPQAAGACPEFGRKIVRCRPIDQAFDFEPIRPGKYDFPENGAADSSRYSVVWWDPFTLQLGKQPSFAVRQEELLKKVDDAVVEQDLKSYYDWRAQRLEAIERGSQPSIRMETITRRAHRPKADDESKAALVEVIHCEREAIRPKGPRFGALVHAVLATAPLRAATSEVEAAAHLQGRILGATEEEIAAAGMAAERALAHPLLQLACEASQRGECRRETPITLLDSDGTLLEGVVDLAFAEKAGWIVLDFKTDQEIEQGREAYSQQVAFYADAVAKATGQETRGILMVL